MRAIESGAAAVLASALACCSPRKAPSGPDPATLHPSCLNACDKVRRLPACSRQARTSPASSLSELLSSAGEYDGKRVRIQGRLDEDGHVIDADGVLPPKTYASWGDQRPLAYGRWDKKRRGEPAPEQLAVAHCCSIDVHGQAVVAEGTLEIAKRPFDDHRLLDPLLCEAR